ncbi:BlaI/MecI/CopY family transcriptional regulator [Amycolatopsis sp. NPDC024027]|uniref:BlaI/MecI/CopY family transcriptional regulator n=1 Tax=Amycolatopsis sp. NPDC024027 TaxID=3154327 RepID=UPI0033C5E292
MGKLGELERAVMDALWARSGPVSVRAVHEALADRGLAYTTVMTVLSRLADKGFLRRERDRRAWLYAPAASRDQYVAELMFEALGETGDRDGALTHFAQAVSAEEAAVLRRALTRKRRT